MYLPLLHLALSKQIAFIQHQMHVMAVLMVIKLVVVLVLLLQDAIIFLLIVFNVLKVIICQHHILVLYWQIVYFQMELRVLNVLLVISIMVVLHHLLAKLKLIAIIQVRMLAMVV